MTRQDLDFALQMFESAVAIDPKFALAHAAIANASVFCYVNFEREQRWLDRANASVQRALAISPDAPEVQVAEGWIMYGSSNYEEASRRARTAIERKADCDGAYVLLGRSLFAAGRYPEVLEIADAAIKASGNDYNTYVPIMNAMGALGKRDALRNITIQRVQVLEAHLMNVAEDARARTILAGDYAALGRIDDCNREANLAMALRPNDALVAYNIACMYCNLGRKEDGMKTLRKAWEAGFRDSDWARNDPDLALLHGDPEFERLYPAPSA
jgi:tetratricopeptide (TPR) repeat protein